MLAKYVERLAAPYVHRRPPDERQLIGVDEAVAAGRRAHRDRVDDADRENEGDLIVAADAATGTIAFFVRYTSGVICMPMLGSRLDELQLPLMVPINTESHRTAFTVSVDIKAGTSPASRPPTARAPSPP